MRKKVDGTQEIIDRILSSPVPEEGRLVHPLQGTKRKRSGQVTVNDIKADKHADIGDWTTKTFVDYFAVKYQDATGGNYRRVYKVDSPSFQEMLKFFGSNGLDRNVWTKKFIDWAFEHRELILRKHNYMTPQTVLRMINFFYQDEVLPKVEVGDVERDTTDTSLLQEINQAISEGKDTEVFARFGIPVAVTYLVKVRGFNYDRLVGAVEARLKYLAANDREQLEKIVLQSIIGSPYPDTFLMLGWRDKFALLIRSFKTESWWRDTDYKGKPLPKYEAILGKS